MHNFFDLLFDIVLDVSDAVLKEPLGHFFYWLMPERVRGKAWERHLKTVFEIVFFVLTFTAVVGLLLLIQPGTRRTIGLWMAIVSLGLLLTCVGIVGAKHLLRRFNERSASVRRD